MPGHSCLAFLGNRLKLLAEILPIEETKPLSVLSNRLLRVGNIPQAKLLLLTFAQSQEQSRIVEARDPVMLVPCRQRARSHGKIPYLDILSFWQVFDLPRLPSLHCLPH